MINCGRFPVSTYDGKEQWQLLRNVTNNTVVNIHTGPWVHYSERSEAFVLAVDANVIGYVYQEKRYVVSRVEFFTFFELDDTKA